MQFRLGFFVKIVLWEDNQLQYGKIVKVHLSEQINTYDIEFSILEDDKRKYTRIHNVDEKFIQLSENTETGLPFTATSATHTFEQWKEEYHKNIYRFAEAHEDYLKAIDPDILASHYNLGSTTQEAYKSLISAQ